MDSRSSAARTRLAALIVGTALVAALVGGFAGGSAAAASGNTASVSLDLADDGITTTTATHTNHNWTVTVDGGVSAELSHLTLDYAGTGTTFQGTTASDVRVLVDGSPAGTISGVATENSNQRLNVTFGTGPTLTGGETVTVNTTGETVSNPGTAGSYSASITLSDGSSVASASSSFQITSGTLSGTVTNATDGTTLGSASVTVLEGQNVVGSATTAADGTYSLTLGPGTYDVSVSRSHFEGGFASGATVTDGGTTTQDVGLAPTGTLDGTVTEASSGDAISGASVQLTRTNSQGQYTTTTGASGGYSKTVATGTYDVQVSASGYATQTKQVSVGPNGTATTALALQQAGTIQGTVTADDGSQLSGMSVMAWDQSSGSPVGTTQTGPSGGYSLSVAGGTYDVIAYDSGGTYEDTFEIDVSVSAGSTTTQDLTMSAAPPTGTLTGTVTGPNGNPVSGTTVEAVDSSYRNFNSTTTDAQGQYSMTVPRGTYEVSTSSASYANDVRAAVTVTGNQATTVDLQLAQAASVDGTVTKANGDAIQGATVVAEGDGSPVYTTTDASGDYQLAVTPDQEYRVAVWAQGRSATPQTVNVSAGNTDTVDFTAESTTIVDSSIEVLDASGVQTDKIGLNAQVGRGMMLVRVLNQNGGQPGMPHDLSGLGVDENTRFRINATVTNYDPSTLLWGAKDVTWSTSQNDSNPDATDITVTTRAVDLQGINPSQNTPIGPLMKNSPSDVQWPSGRNDRADRGWNKTVYFGLFDMGTAPADLKDNFAGMTVTTNAQTFAPPRVVNDTLKVWVAGPHRTTDGNTHDGFYEATIPDAQLQDWGVDPANAASELSVLYQGKDQNFQVTTLADGVRIELDIHYSAGTVAVEPSSTAGSGGGGGSATSLLTTSVSTTPSDEGVTAVVETVAAGDPAVVPLADVAAGGVTVTEATVNFDVGTTADNEVAVTAAASPPASVPAAPADSVLNYVTVDVIGTLDGRDSGGSLTFEVDADRLAERGATAAAVQAYHYDDATGSWDPIPTTHLGGDSFEATTGSFSTFAVGLADAGQATTPSATPATTDAGQSTPDDTPTATTTPTSTTGTDGPGFGVLVTVLAVLALLGALAVRRR